jgi:hypothetical protein
MTHFPETGHNVPPDFLAYWFANGGLAQFGYPLSEVITETLEDGKQYEVQYFERVRMARHPENGPPYHILLGLPRRNPQTCEPATTGIDNPSRPC